MKFFKHISSGDLFIGLGDTPEWIYHTVDEASSSDPRTPMYCRERPENIIIFVHLVDWVYNECLAEIEEEEARRLDHELVDRIAGIECEEEIPAFSKIAWYQMTDDRRKRDRAILLAKKHTRESMYYDTTTTCHECSFDYAIRLYRQKCEKPLALHARKAAGEQTLAIQSTCPCCHHVYPVGSVIIATGFPLIHHKDEEWDTLPDDCTLHSVHYQVRGEGSYGIGMSFSRLYLATSHYLRALEIIPTIDRSSLLRLEVLREVCGQETTILTLLGGDSPLY